MRTYFSLILFIVLLVFTNLSFSQGQERITITTYYPAPFGVYRDLEVRNQLRIGGSSSAPRLSEGSSSGILEILAPVKVEIEDGGAGKSAFGSLELENIVFQPGGHGVSYRRFYTATSGYTYCDSGWWPVCCGSGNKLGDPANCPCPGWFICVKTD